MTETGSPVSRHLAALQLDPGRVRTTIDFLEAYGATIEDELQRTAESRRPSTSGENVALDVDSQHDRERILRLDAATSFREAAQWALYVDLPRATNFMLRAAASLDADNAGYRLFMTTVSAGNGPLLGPAIAAATRLIRAGDPTWSDTIGPNAIRPGQVAPQQLAYALVALAANRERLDASTSEYLRSLAETSAHRSGATPVGALGTPILRFWAIGAHLLSARPEEAVPVIMQHVRIMSGNYAERMEQARVNTHLWNNGAAPVDVADLDIAVLTALTVQRFGAGPVAALMPADADRGPLSSIPMQLGLALAEWSGRPRLQ